MRENRSKINACAAPSCLGRLDLRPHFDSAWRLYFLCPICSLLLAALEERVARVAR